jgi:hypothetical protein
LCGERRRINLGDMAGKPRTVSARAMEIADIIDREVAARTGPNSTFAEREEAAAAIGAEVMAEFAKLNAAMNPPKDES